MLLTFFDHVCLIACEWFQVKSSWVFFKNFSIFHFGSAGFTGSMWYHARSSWVPSYYSFSFWCCWLYRRWAILYQMQLDAFWSLPDPVYLTVCRWFYARSSWVPSHCPLPHFGFVGLTASEWFFARSSWVIFNCHSHSHSHSGPVGLTVCKLFYTRYSSVLSECPHSHFGSVGLIASEWFYTMFSLVPFDGLTPILILLAWQGVGHFMPNSLWCFSLTLCNLPSLYLWFHVWSKSK